MAGKPELSVTPQSQPPGVQNVVVYVSNDNFAQAYAVGQQNVAGFTSQGSSSSIQTSQPQNGTVVYANSAHAVAPMVSSKNLVNKIQPNGVLENGSVAHNNFYASPVIAQNGFPQANIAAYQNNVNPQSVHVLNNGNFDGAVKNVIGFSASTSDLYPTSGQAEKANVQGRTEHKAIRDESVASETYITTDSGYVVMGAEVQGQNSVMFPRCDSVRSETAESSCSSLSSGDSQAEGVVIQAPTTQSGDIVMYEGGVSVNVRPAQPLGNLVLTMVPPAAGSQPQQVMGLPTASPQGVSPQPQISAHVTIPSGWKRIVTNGIVIYIRYIVESTYISSICHLLLALLFLLTQLNLQFYKIQIISLSVPVLWIKCSPSNHRDSGLNPYYDIDVYIVNNHFQHPG